MLYLTRVKGGDDAIPTEPRLPNRANAPVLSCLSVGLSYEIKNQAFFHVFSIDFTRIYSFGLPADQRGGKCYRPTCGRADRSGRHERDHKNV